MNSVTILPRDYRFHGLQVTPKISLETQLDQALLLRINVAQEAVSLWGNLNDWHHAIGTGPFILTDFVDSSSASFVRNPPIGELTSALPAQTCLC